MPPRRFCIVFRADRVATPSPYFFLTVPTAASSR